MDEIGKRLVAKDDERQHFHLAYLHSTKAVMDDVDADRFVDSAWVERWGLAFAELYLDAYDIWERGGDPSGPWRVAFEASRDPEIPPVRHALLGINAHINYDLPQAFLAVISDDEFDAEEIMERRAADHAHVDSILVRRVRQEDKNLQRVEDPGDRTIVDRLMTPFNRAGTRKFLKEGREKVWRNAGVLSAARRLGPAVYTRELARLEQLSRDRVADLVTPRYVLVGLARHGFGVVLPPPWPSDQTL
ncbi:DUF5995 family protein [Actinomycetota bacterium]